jgi:hypothetical protein
MSRGAYVLLGKGGLNEGNGYQWYAGGTTNDPYACIETWFYPDNDQRRWVPITAPHGKSNPLHMMPVPTGQPPGLYLNGSAMGYHNGTEWRAYIQNDGKFYFGGPTGKYVHYDGTTLNIRGALVADDITSGTLNADRISAGTLHANKIVANTIDYGQIYTSGVNGAITNCSYEFPSNSSGVNCSNIQWIATITFTVPYESKVLITGYLACQTLSACFDGSCWLAIERMHWEYYNGYYQWVSQGYIAASTSSLYEGYQFMYGNISIADVPLSSGDYQYRLKMSAYAYEGNYDNRQITYSFNILNKRLMGMLIKR